MTPHLLIRRSCHIAHHIEQIVLIHNILCPLPCGGHIVRTAVLIKQLVQGHSAALQSPLCDSHKLIDLLGHAFVPEHRVAGTRRHSFCPKGVSRQTVAKIIIPILGHVFNKPSFLYDAVSMAIA